MPPSSSPIRRHVIYRGRVQGVGFRWTVDRIAKPLEVAGYVRNCADGTVELVAQGPADAVARLLDGVTEAMTGYIDSAEVSEEPVQADLSGFSIRR